MKEISRELYHQCSETLIFPFLDEGASDREIAIGANIQVLFDDGKAPRIRGNCSLGELSVEDIGGLQVALKRANELAAPVAAAGDGGWSAHVADPAEQLKWAEIAIKEANKHIESLRTELQAAREALLECTIQMNKHGNDDNWETVTMEYAQAIKDGRAVLEAPAQADAGSEAT